MPPQIVLVTGASSGIGEAAARRYAAAGSRVIATARRGDRLTALVDEFGEDLIFVSGLDVRDRDAIEQLPASLPAEFAEVDVLVAGLIARPDDRGDSVLQIAPPLICDAAVLDEIVDRLHDVLAYAGRFMDLAEAPAAVA